MKVHPDERPGAKTVVLAAAGVRSDIAAARPGDVIAFGLSESSGVDLSRPVGNETAETYGFQMNRNPGAYNLEVSTTLPAPDGATVVLSNQSPVLARARVTMP